MADSHPHTAVTRPVRRLGSFVRLAAGLTVVGVGVATGACGSDGDGGGGSAADRGADVYADQGCAGCHGEQGQGGVGPALRGLAGSTVELDDGSQVQADEAYIRRSIVDPDADRVDGYSARMPRLDLTDDQVEAVVAYVRTLG